MVDADDAFEAFAAQMARAANVEAEADLPLIQGAAQAVSVDLSKVSTIDEVAEILHRAEAMRKSAMIQKKAANAFLNAYAINKGVDAFDTNQYSVQIERDDAEAFDADAFQAELQLKGGTAPDWIKTKLSLTPAEIKSLTAEQRALLGTAIVQKGEKVSITVERK